jgi:hypothetical protein
VRPVRAFRAAAKSFIELVDIADPGRLAGVLLPFDPFTPLGCSMGLGPAGLGGAGGGSLACTTSTAQHVSVHI